MKPTRIGRGGRGEIAVGSTAEWPNTASVSEMHCMQDGHVGKRTRRQSAAENSGNNFHSMATKIKARLFSPRHFPHGNTVHFGLKTRFIVFEEHDEKKRSRLIHKITRKF